MEFAEFQFGSKEKPVQRDRSFPNWKQVHGARIAEVTGPGQDIGEVDGMWTCVPGQKIAVVTADCVPILLTNRKWGVVAALHAGWRGTEQKIVHEFFKSLPAEFSNVREWSALIGPSIRACCYQVSEDLIVQFKNKFSDLNPTLIEPAPRMLDLIELNVHQLIQSGVEEIVIHPDCTHCTKGEHGDFRYFSYRRGDRKSRQYTVLNVKP